jgi:hypothetical protein
MGYDMYQGTDGNGEYFRLNIWGMGEYRKRLWEDDMLVDVGSKWPDATEFGVAEHDENGYTRFFPWVDELYEYTDGSDINHEDVPEHITDAQVQAFENYQAAENSVRFDSYQDEPEGIPVYKLGSNDGWLVTPDEIRAAFKNKDIDELRLAKEQADYEKDDDESYWLAFLIWMYESIDEGGFRVW